MNSLLKKTTALFFQGLLALLPLIVTIYVLVFAFSFITNITDFILLFIPERYEDIDAVIILVKTFSSVLIFVAIIVFGLLIKTVIGKELLRRIDITFNAIPGIKVVYKSIRQVVDFFSKEQKSVFTKPVLVEYPSAGIWAVGFNTGQITGHGIPADEKRYTVFVPTTPNPTSGFLAVVPPEKIRELDTTAEEAIKLILTGGIIKTG